MTDNPMAAERARADIYELALTLRYLLVERDTLGAGVAAGLLVGTAEDATRQLSAMVERRPDVAREAVALMKDCPDPGPFYKKVINILRSMLSRAEGAQLLDEMAGEA